jgi:hypothetical protein
VVVFSVAAMVALAGTAVGSGLGAGPVHADTPVLTVTCDSPPGTLKVVGTSYAMPATGLRITISRVPGTPDETFPSSGFDPLPQEFMASHTFTRFVAPATRPAGTYSVVAATYRVSDGQGTFVESQKSAISLPCVLPSPSPTPPALNPQLACNPTSVHAGSMVTAVGTGFPRNLGVVLTWRAGINAVPPLIATTDPTGGLQVPILIFPHDVVGVRTLAVTPDPSAIEPGFKEIDAQCLVAPGAVQPRDFAWRR